MTEKKFDYLVYIGRFEPWTLAHAHVARMATEFATQVIILVGSSGDARSLKNPLTFEDREEMIKRANSDYIVLPIYDFKDNKKWVEHVEATVNELVGFHLSVSSIQTGNTPRIGIIGHHKDSSSDYIDMFPNWGKVEIKVQVGAHNNIISATDVREAFYENKAIYGSVENCSLTGAVDVSDMIKLRVFEDMSYFFQNTPEGQWLIDEYNFAKAYKGLWTPDPTKPSWVTEQPIMNTGDAVVQHKDKVLLIKRGKFPGKGLWALPGGFIENSKYCKEKIIDGVVRELHEETGIRIQKRQLYDSVVDSHVFDDVERDVRGRVITHAYYFKLDKNMETPIVEGSDDATEAKWFALKDIKRSELFADHFHIISHFIKSRIGENTKVKL